MMRNKSLEHKPADKLRLPLSIFKIQDGRRDDRQNKVSTTIYLVKKLMDRF